MKSTSLIRMIPIDGVKNKVIALCLLQAVLTSFCILTVLLYFPEVVLEDQSTQIAETIEQNVVPDQIQVFTLHPPPSNGHISSEIVFDTFRYSLFRFDKVENIITINDMNKEMVNIYGDFTYFKMNEEELEEYFPLWVDLQSVHCDGCLVVYGKRIIRLKDATINPTYGKGKVGGEEVYEVMEQTVEKEMYNLKKGYFSIEVSTPFEMNEPLIGDLQRYTDALLVLDKATVNHEKMKTIDKYAIIVTRYEYANFYHTTMNWYDTFLLMVLFKLNPDTFDLIWMDSHPLTALDDSWQVLFGEPIRAGTIETKRKYKRMIWNGFMSKSEINQHKSDELPFTEEFRHFVLSRFEIKDGHVRDCDKLRITVIWRRNHVAHPRNPDGFISRKIGNEEDVWRALRTADYRAVVNGVQLDDLDMSNQLDLISRTDILIGMHGAGLSHILYLPKTAAVIELYPLYMSVGNAHFRAMAKWRGLPYMAWNNDNKTLETPNHETHLPTMLLADMARTMVKTICGSKKELYT